MSGAALVRTNAEYDGWRLALCIAGIMYVYVSIVSTALILHATCTLLGITPESARVASEITRFETDDTFWLNLVFAAVTEGLVWLHRRHIAIEGPGEGIGPSDAKRTLAIAFLLMLSGGVASLILTGGTR